jgi:hypothetical protein
MKNLIVLAGFLCVCSSATAWAQLGTRCATDDDLSPSQVYGRNAWARKCGYISAGMEAYLDGEGMYQVFQNACFQNPCSTNNCPYFAPVSEYANCVYGLVLLGTCVASLVPSESGAMLAESFAPDTWLPALSQPAAFLVPAEAQTNHT